MSTIDLAGMSSRTMDTIVASISDASELYSEITLTEVTGVVVVIGLILGAYEWHRRWTKRKGYRMAVEQERQKIKELLTEGLGDLVLQAEVDGKLSMQQGDRLYQWLSDQLGLPDLVPTKRRAKIVKNEIKARRHSPKYKVEKPRIPGKPLTAPREKFRHSQGNFITKLGWRK